MAISTVSAPKPEGSTQANDVEQLVGDGGPFAGPVPEESTPQSPTDAPRSPSPTRRRCVGTPPAKDRPHTATCCYPSRELLLAPLRALKPKLSECYAARKDAALAGTMHVAFRIERDGRVLQACSEPSTDFDDADGATTTCVLRAVTTLKYPAQSPEGEAVCGLVRVVYPLKFSQ